MSASPTLSPDVRKLEDPPTAGLASSPIADLDDDLEGEELGARDGAACSLDDGCDVCQ